MERCVDCKHEAHAAGECKNCNCGSSVISHSDALPTDQSKVVTWDNFKRGEVSTSKVARIKPRRTGND